MSEEDVDIPYDRDETGRFLPGNRGKKLGSRTKLANEFVKDMLSAWNRYGYAIIEAAIAENPAAVLAIYSKIIPKQEDVKIEVSLKDIMESAERRLTDLRLDVRNDSSVVN